jgi:hypothetical protein
MLDHLTLAATFLVAALPAFAPYVIAFAVFAVGAVLFPLVLGYTFSQARKFIASWAVLVGTGAALFITGYDPSLTEAVTVLGGYGLGLVEVFANPRRDAEDFSKALGQLRGAVISVVSFFVVVPASTEAYIAMAVGAVVSVLAVRQVRNEPATLRS